jgi:hypothetical protein
MSSEPAPVPATDSAAVALRLQILTTEHSSLLATRSLAWNEVFSRAGMLLTTLSGALLAMALVSQGSHFGDEFLLFGIVVLPIVLFVGLGTFARLASANYVEALCVIGMNRIRAGYLELAPDLERFFVTGTHDDRPGVALTMGIQPGGSSLVHMLAATPTLVSVLNSLVLAAIVAFVLLYAHVAVALVLGTGVIVFVAGFAAHGEFGRRRVSRMQRATQPLFPGSPRD